VNQARSGQTDQLGRMLAPAGVRYVVKVTALAPVISLVQNPTEYPVPADLAPALAHQLDLQSVFAETGISVYENTAWLPERSAVASASRTAVAAEAAIGRGSPGTPDVLGTATGAPIVPGAVPVLPGPAASLSYQGTIPAGTVLSALAPAARWSLVASDGTTYPMSAAFGWAGQYRVAGGGRATLRFNGSLWSPLSVGFELVLWLLVAAALIEQRGIMRPWLQSVLLRWRRHSEPHPIPELDFEAEADQFGGLEE
jgi:hypothetical protein